MSAGLTILVTAWGGVCAVWVGLLVAQLRMRRDGLWLGERFVTPTGVDPRALGRGDGGRDGGDKGENARACAASVCVVIPARNEGAGLERCVESVLRQDHPSLSLVIVDDRSEDDTAAVAERIARSDARVSVRRIESLPAGWLGKSHALWRGTRGVESEWLLFVDADCTLDRGAVRTAVAEARVRSVELLSLWPRQAAGGFWEHLLIPLCAGIIALWFGSRVNRAGSGAAFANGQFLLIKRSAYERIDGHRSVRRAIIEDVPLAEHAKRSGVRCRVASGRDWVAVRMYDGYRAIREGWARIYVGALRSGTKIAVGVLWLLFGSLLPFAGVAVLGVEWASPAVDRSPSGPGLWVLSAVCMTHLVLVYVVSFRFWGLGGCRRRYLLLYPVSVVLVMGILVRAWWWLVVRRRIGWRRTSYVIDRHGRIADC